MMNEENNVTNGSMVRPTMPSGLPDMKTKPASSKSKLWLKLLLIVVISLGLLIPQQMMLHLVNERNDTLREAEQEVGGKWSGSQRIAGPVICIPSVKKDGNSLYILPGNLSVQGDAQVQTLRRGIFDITVFTAPLDIHGEFAYPDELSSYALNKYDLERAHLLIGVRDLHGLTENVTLQWGNNSYPMKSDREAGLGSVLRCPVDMKPIWDGQKVSFSVKLHLKGSEELYFVPVGNSNTVTLTSNCATPSFDGSYLPVKREVSEKGFMASWKVLALNRDFSQVVIDWGNSVRESAFGVNMKVPVEQYQQTTRAVKYAFLIIVLTFSVVLFVEIRKGKHIHPVQYLLVGLALILFYTLLLSFSEHIAFLWSYVIASLMTVGLITAYMAAVLKIRKTALAIGALLSAIYLFIYVLLQLESYALLVGSVGLFVILGLAMYASQKVNWYQE
ncbi:MAG: cell envelope integrity protein CreD [Bacteroidales bacterium]|nr:cell envelope integrity protein CreD [Bacteroidales bacterium]